MQWGSSPSATGGVFCPSLLSLSPSLHDPGGAPSPTTVHGFSPPSENLALKRELILTCTVTGFNPATSLGWFRNDEAVATSVPSTSNPLQEGETLEEPSLSSMFSISPEDFMRETFTCVVKTVVLPPLRVHKTEDEDTGNPSSSKKPRRLFQKVEAASKMSMSCIVEGERPSGVSIMWQENCRPLTEDAYAIDTSSEDPHFMYSKLSIANTTSLEGCIYSCTVGQQRA
ncbi:UNVERIFIED_CONTAM: hypothetical protein K2H54_043562 [Gekko kuhli]